MGPTTRLAGLRAKPPEACRVDPANSRASRLELPSWVEPLVLGGLGALVMLAGMLSVWRPKLSENGGRRLICGMVPVCLLLFICSGGVCFWLAWRDDYKSVEPRLKEVPCSILASHVRSYYLSRGDAPAHEVYGPVILFQYEWRGRVWCSNWLDFARRKGSSSYLDRALSTNPAPAEKAVARYPEGASATCWLDPARPWVAVLEKNHNSVWVLYLCGTVFGGIGLVSLAGWFACGPLLRRFRKSPSVP